VAVAALTESAYVKPEAGATIVHGTGGMCGGLLRSGAGISMFRTASDLTTATSMGVMIKCAAEAG